MYKAAVIGLGNMGMLYDLEPQRPHPSTHVFAYEMSFGFRLICGIDSDERKKEILHDVSVEAMFYSSLEEAISTGILNDVDVISICTPPSTHLDILLKLIELGIGKILFCEKPVVKEMKEADELIKAVRESDVIVIPNISRRWNTGLRQVRELIESKKHGALEKINIRYTRGIYNTGAHLFDLLKMWTGSPIQRVFTLGKTKTSAYPEKTFSFYFEQCDGVSGYAEAVDDRKYYLFDIDFYCTEGKIEMRNSGDDIRFYMTAPHHLFQGFCELSLDSSKSKLLNDACIKNALDNIYRVLENREEPYCSLMDAIYPLHVATALERSCKDKAFVEV